MALRMAFWMALAIPALGHVVTQISGEWKPGPPWEIEVLFDAGYAVPEWRGDPQTSPPDRNWLLGLGEPGWAPLRKEAERFLRESLQLSSGGAPVDWRVEFIDFAKSPPDFPELLNDGAYFRLKLTGEKALASTVAIRWSSGPRPSLVLKLQGEEAGYLTLAPGQSQSLDLTKSIPLGRPLWNESLRQGFLHVLPLGLDHLLFVMGLFFYQRAWRPLLAQSLAFTAAHTVTLGLASAGWIRWSGQWVEPMIALSVMVVALENLKTGGEKAAGPFRLAIVFGFGLIHGLGFAGALSAALKPGEGFLAALFSANLGVEIAQVSVLAAAWCLTLNWHRSQGYERIRLVACLGISGTGAFWVLQRIGWIS